MEIKVLRLLLVWAVTRTVSRKKVVGHRSLSHHILQYIGSHEDSGSHQASILHDHTLSSWWRSCLINYDIHTNCLLGRQPTFMKPSHSLQSFFFIQQLEYCCISSLARNTKWSSGIYVFHGLTHVKDVFPEGLGPAPCVIRCVRTEREGAVLPLTLRAADVYTLAVSIWHTYMGVLREKHTQVIHPTIQPLCSVSQDRALLS